MITLWGRANSSNVMKPLWLLEELGIPYRRVDTGGPFGGTDTAAYRAKNPPGLIPLLEDGPFALWESNAILRYLGSTHGAAFWPEGAQVRARIDQWMDAQQTLLTRPQSAVFQNLVRKPLERRDHAVLREAVFEADRVWRILDGMLAHQSYVVGNAPTLADFAWGVHVHRWFAMPVDRSEAPHLAAWYARLLERPAYAATCAGPLS